MAANVALISSQVADLQLEGIRREAVTATAHEDSRRALHMMTLLMQGLTSSIHVQQQACQKHQHNHSELGSASSADSSKPPHTKLKSTAGPSGHAGTGHAAGAVSLGLHPHMPAEHHEQRRSGYASPTPAAAAAAAATAALLAAAAARVRAAATTFAVPAEGEASAAATAADAGHSAV